MPLRSTRRSVLAGAAASSVILPLAGSMGAWAKGPARQPNILFIMADDMGHADLSCYGQTAYRTPVLDRLAAEGALFHQAYANSAVCSATRTALVTGRYQQRFAIGLEEPFGPKKELSLPAGTPTIASRFKAIGYRTALVGKWHVGAPPKHGPTHYGYDHFYGLVGGAGDYFRYSDPDNGLQGGFYNDDEPIRRDGYLTDVLADEAMRWIGQGGAPFLLSLHFNAPHWPWEGPDDQAHANALKELRDSTGGSLETYGVMVRAMDAAIGRVLASLRRAGLERDTIVVFTSDNGGERYSNTWPLTGYKGELLEGGIRVPLIVRWPAHIRAGTTSEQVMISMDFMPTLLAAAGAPPLSSSDTDGTNLLPQLTGAAPAISRTLFWRYKANDQAAVRDGDWKYLRLGGKEHLFHVTTDPRERAEQRVVRPDIFNNLKQKFAAWEKGILPYTELNNSEDVGNYYSDRY